MIENLIKRIEKEYKYGSKFKLSLAEMFFYVKWFGMIVYSNFLGKSFFFQETLDLDQRSFGRGILQNCMVETLAQRVKDVLMDGDNNLTQEDATLIASMAHRGLLGFLDSTVLTDLDLSPMPSDQLQRYSGQGRCGNTKAKEDLRSWASRKDWTVPTVRYNLEPERNEDIIEWINTLHSAVTGDTDTEYPMIA